MSIPDQSFLEMIGAVGERAPGIDEKLMLMNQFRATAPRKAELLDRYMLDRLQTLGATVTELHGVNRELAGTLEELKREALAPPWHPAVFLGHIETREGTRAVVAHGSARRVVAIANEVELSPADIGGEVLLAHDLNVVLERSALGPPPCGEIASFERNIDAARVVVRWRDEEVVLHRAGALLDTVLEPGDLVRWDHNTWFVYERLERKEPRRIFLEEAPDIRREQIGGLDAMLEDIHLLILGRYEKPDVAAKYRLELGSSILFWGPPGCGKTTTARFIAAECSRLLGRRFKFAHIQPSDYLSAYVGETQQNIRRLIDMLRREEDWVAFFDDAESMGRVRGDSLNKWRDDVTSCWLEG
ncbi:MAG TPA: AAA family ATPase, partial [Candidatus Hydrogenedentes bacterium]|nr:AAA family ATPase [Candidatus Hydrogenedentota bacterium]